MARSLSRPWVRLRHQEDALALTFERFAHPDFGFAAMVFPTVVEERHASINRAIHNFLSRWLIFGIAQVMTAQAKRRDLYSSFAEPSKGNLCHG